MIHGKLQMADCRLIGAKSRRGYTLLEVTLAAMLSALVLFGLYLALDIQLRLVDTGRSTLEETTVARSVMDRLGADLRGNVGPVMPPSASGQNQTSADGSTNNQSTLTDPTAPLVAFYGGEDWMVIYVNRAPRNIGTSSASQPSRCISYAVEKNEDGSLRLLRQETLAGPVPNNQTNPYQRPDIPSDNRYVLADKIKSVQFRYLGPNNSGNDVDSWATEWDCGSPDGTPGNSSSSSGTLPFGPPCAVNVRLVMLVERNGKILNDKDDDEDNMGTFVQTIHLPSSNPPTATSSTTPDPNQQNPNGP